MMTLKDKLRDARDAIDEVFGSGFAKKHPELVGDCIKAEAVDSVAYRLKWLGTGDAATHLGALEALGAAICGSGRLNEGLAGAVRDGFDRIGDLAIAVHEISEAIGDLSASTETAT